MGTQLTEWLVNFVYAPTSGALINTILPMGRIRFSDTNLSLDYAEVFNGLSELLTRNPMAEPPALSASA